MGQVTVTERRRGVFGKIFKALFFAWNILMIVWLVAAMANIGGMPPPGSAAEQAGRNVGAAAGMGFILAFWALGSAILGALALATRGKLVSRVVEE